MKFLPALVLATCAAGFAHARPMIIEETSKLTLPDASYYPFAWRVGIDGDDAVLYGSRELPQGPDECCTPDSEMTAYLYHRNGTQWNFVRTLATVIDGNEGDGANSKGLDMRNGVMALSLQPLHVFERVGTDWVEKPVVGQGDRGDYVVVNGNRILFGDGCWGASVYERDTAGAWRATNRMYGDYCGSTDGASGGPVGIWNHWAVVSNPWNDDGLPGPALTFFRNNGTGWPQQERRVAPEGHAYNDMLMFNDLMYVADNSNFGSWVFERGSDDQWRESDRLISDGDYMSTRYAVGFYGAGGWFAADGDLVLHQVWDADRQADVIQVFKFDATHRYKHFATLVTSDGQRMGGHVAISGRRVLVSGEVGAYYYDLPESLDAPAAIQDTFPNPTASGWTTLPGSQFAIAQSGATRVFRQSSTAGDAGAVLNAGDWTNQAIQAEVKPTAISTGGSDRWVGLMTRRTDAANYYYVTLRASGIVALKRMYHGQFANLASATFPFTLNRNYRLRLESVGTLQRVYVDGVKVLEARDGDLAHGHAGLVSYRAAADYDNVVVTPANLATIFEQHDGQVWAPPQANRGPWGYAGGQWAYIQDGTNVIFRQTSTSGDARAIIGPLTDNRDTVVETRARLRTFGAPPDPWFGLLLSYGDPYDYIYLSMRKSNTLTLRRLRSGQIQQLGAVTQTVTPNTWYRLRLEQVGTRLRAYVNGQLKIETTTDYPGGGQVGFVTYAAAADYDDFVAVRP
jgi:hypothetical protein